MNALDPIEELQEETDALKENLDIFREKINTLAIEQIIEFTMYFKDMNKMLAANERRKPHPL